MEKILIVGAGFAGLTAASILSRERSLFKVIVVDKKPTFDFLPMLPDVIGRGINSKFLSCQIENIARKLGFTFLNEEVLRLDLEKKQIISNKQSLNYDYLVLASGSETNFYADENIKRYAYALDSCSDAEKILARLKEKDIDNYIISGAGYTGIEVATNLRRFLSGYQKHGKIIIVERAPTILGPLAQWIKDYVMDNLRKLGIDIFVNTTIEAISQDGVRLGPGRLFDEAIVIWTAGVRTADFIQNLKAEKSPQGRLKVDEYLRVNNNCFAVGDTAYFQYQGTYLRMAVQFAISHGRCAAQNILRSIKGKKLRKYKLLDLGYIIPMANNNSCGKVFGLNLKGKVPTFLHFLMCIYRSYTMRNKVGIVRQLFRGQKLDVRGQMTEVRGQRTEDR